MAIFDENKLKNEELSGGFDFDDGETFSLNKKQEKAIPPPKPEPETKKVEIPSENKKEQKVKVITPPVHKVEKKEEKKRTVWPWIAASLLVVALLGALGYYLYTINTPQFFLQHSYVDMQSQKTTFDTVEEVITEEVEEIIPVATPEEDTLDVVELEKIPEDKNKTEKPAQVNQQVQTPKPVPQKKEITTYKKVEKPVKIKKVETTSSTPVKKTIKKEPEKKKITETKVVPKPQKEVTASKIVKKKDAPKPDLSQIHPATGLYVIEVYSSTSYDDAKIWMNKLNRRNLNASIVTQRIRDKILYKVRFGKFPTEFDARQMAMKLGFSRFYIDRIK